MKTLRYIPVMLLLGFMTILACKMPASPEKYFDAAALNANAVAHFGSDYFITALGYGKRPAGTGPGEFSYEQQVGFAIQRVQKYMENVEGLMATNDSKALLDASKDLFSFTLESYNKDHLPIARLIDRKAPEEEVAKAMEALDKKSYETFLVKYDKLYNIGTQYAKEHGIRLAEGPKFNP
ncbi:hypothetical protein [Chitinophaga barathri]|uniref:Uncharacterized protein n=1 Tax=Chitinophaga barathri TaxID=1647451 RepID=A0A3N4N0N7_9BACT|nr:hypothetical protein [Chitinophaga barathri]RPD41203.1 hypothetical protein EG028_11015 [Chitinophaga barathri]